MNDDTNGNLLDEQGNILVSAEERSRCEIWTRVMGYHRPINAWNAGKQREHADRAYFREDAPKTRQELALAPLQQALLELPQAA